MSAEAAQPAPGREHGDLHLIRALWPLLAAAFIGQLPLVASNLFIVAMAADTDSSVALVGGLRGLSGIAALATGVLAAPMIDRWPRAWSIAAGLAVLGGAALLGALSQLPALIAFYFLVGVGSAVLMPSIQAASGDERSGTGSVRSTTLVAGVPSLAPAAAGPLLALPATWWGWQGDLLAIAAAALALALVSGCRLSHAPPGGVARPGYLAAFRAVAAAPGAVALLMGSTLRAALFFGWLAYYAAYFSQRFGLSLTMLGLLVSMNGLAFFLTNQIGGRLTDSAGMTGERRLRPAQLAIGGFVVATATLPLALMTPLLPLAVLLTVLHTAGHGASFVGIIALLVGRYPTLRGAVMGLNVAGSNLGTFGGAVLGGVGLAVGGYAGLAASLLLVALPGLVSLGVAVRRTDGPTRPTA